jgi:hypothetical protein
MLFCLSFWALSVEPSLAGTTISCVELSDPDRTRVLMELDARIVRLEIVTPELTWSAPGQPETRRFESGKSDVSPNLVGREGVYVEDLRGKDGALRGVDFGVLNPDALEAEGLRGSLMLHEPFLDDRAVGSLYYTATGNLVSVVPLTCRRYPE